MIRDQDRAGQPFDKPSAVDFRPGLSDAKIPDISVVLPFCNERANLPELLERLGTTLDSLGLSYEFLFIDDGSTDGGAALLEEAARSDHRIKVLVLSRNFGQHIAGTAGIDAARGRLVLWMDTDLQESPEDIPKFIAKQREGFDVVYARRKCREQGRLRGLLSHGYLRLLNRLVGLEVSPDRACMRLFSASVADSLRKLQERNRYMGYLMPWVGYRSAEIEIEVDPRRRGQTKYSWLRLAKLGLIGLMSFSVAPLRVAAFFSGATILACLVGVAYVLYRYFAYGFVISGWASLIMAMLVLHSLQFAVLAIMGEYVGLTYTEAKRRPLYLCSRAVNFSLGAEVTRSRPRAGLTARAPTADQTTLAGVVSES